jgi:C-terminal processing protease CtpA/Prc
MNGRLAVIAAAAFLAGCAGARAKAGPEDPNRAAVEIRADEDEAMEAVARMYKRDGYALEATGADSFTAEKGAELITLKFREVADSVRVTGTAERLAHQGTGLEEVSQAPDLRADLQLALERAKMMVEGGVVGLTLARDLTVESLAPGGPAEEGGARTGDRVFEVAGQSVTTPEEADARLRGDPNTEVEVGVLRAGVWGAKVELTLKRRSWARVYPGE